MPTADKPLSSRSVLAIIKACRESQVSELTFGDLCISFSKQTDSLAKTPSHSVAAITESQQPNDDALEHEELVMREEELAHMLVENPALYEELVVKGELEKANDGPTNE